MDLVSSLALDALVVLFVIMLIRHPRGVIGFVIDCIAIIFLCAFWPFGSDDA